MYQASKSGFCSEKTVWKINKSTTCLRAQSSLGHNYDSEPLSIVIQIYIVVVAR